jgi:excisionase family DNA binding protein
VLSVEELATRWRVNRKSIYEAIARGELPVVRIGPRIIRVARSVVESIESQGRAVPEGK